MGPEAGEHGTDRETTPEHDPSRVEMTLEERLQGEERDEEPERRDARRGRARPTD